MRKNTPIILSNSLNIERGGVTKAAITRANTLAEHFGCVHIFTFLYQSNHSEIIDKLYKEELLNKKVKVHNMFEDMVPQNESGKKEKENKHLLMEEGLIYFKDNKQKSPSYRYYKNGLYVKYKRFDSEGNLLFIDYMDGSRHRTKREEYNENGYLSRVRHMDNNMNKSRLDQYFGDTDQCHLTVWVSPRTGKDVRFILFGDDPIEYETSKDIRKAWVEDRIRAFERPVIITDTRENDKISTNLHHRNIKRIAVIHSTHLKKPYNILTKVRDNDRDDYQFLFKNLDSFHGIVFLTKDQKEDVQTIYGDKANFSVIPHPVQKMNLNSGVENSEKYNPYLAVTLARYEKHKGLDEGIKAFKYVVDNIPSAQYHIYGYGREHQNLTQLIRKLNIEDNVKLKGYTRNPHLTFKSAACSVLTSNFEGFGMVLTESLVAGTPVVSYNTKYGPHEIIRNEENGYIVEKGNKKLLAEKILKIMGNQYLRGRLSQNAVEVSKRFSYEKYRSAWVNLLKRI